MGEGGSYREKQYRCHCGGTRFGRRSKLIRTTFDHDRTRSIVKSIPLFANVTDDEVESLLDKLHAYNFERGEFIFLSDQPASQMYIVLKGQVKVVEITADGQERVMAFRHKGDYFGEMDLIDGMTDFATIIAAQPCKMLLITKDVFDEFFFSNSRALAGVVNVLCRRLRECWVFHYIIGMKNAESKVRATLARYGKTLGISDSDGVIINSLLTHQGLADRVLISRETVTRVINKMKERQEIEIVEGRRIKLLPAFYEKLAQCEHYKALPAGGNQNTK
jgi:CRP/FNR family transcriptional regulator, cyclic AMP receptor protein